MIAQHARKLLVGDIKRNLRPGSIVLVITPQKPTARQKLPILIGSYCWSTKCYLHNAESCLIAKNCHLAIH